MRMTMTTYISGEAAAALNKSMVDGGAEGEWKSARFGLRQCILVSGGDNEGGLKEQRSRISPWSEGE